MNFELIAEEARNNLGSIVSALNSNVAGRAIFAGNEVSTLPIVSAEDIVAAVRTALTGATTSADVRSALDTFFDPPGGDFETLIYQGATASLAPMQLGDGESVDLDLRADSVAFRATLKETTLAVLMAETVPSLITGEAAVLAKSLAEGLYGAQDAITAISADLGFAEGRVDQALTRISAEITSLEIVRGQLVEVDPFKTATELENVQLQLETLYTLTARSSRLSLVNFLS